VAKVPTTFNRIGNIVSGAIKPAASKIGPVAGITDRNNAKSPQAPSPQPGLGDNRTQVDTYFTRGPQPGEQPALIYTGDRMWARITLILETAGPVAIGTSSKLIPVQGGNGALLRTGVPTVFMIAKGTKLFVASTGVNRVNRVIEPLPWLEQIVGVLGLVADGIIQFATGKRG
jgi:hypothetical protein